MYFSKEEKNLLLRMDIVFVFHRQIRYRENWSNIYKNKIGLCTNPISQNSIVSMLIYLNKYHNKLEFYFYWSLLILQTWNLLILQKQFKNSIVTSQIRQMSPLTWVLPAFLCFHSHASKKIFQKITHHGIGQILIQLNLYIFQKVTHHQ